MTRKAFGTTVTAAQARAMTKLHDALLSGVHPRDLSVVLRDEHVQRVFAVMRRMKNQADVSEGLGSELRVAREQRSK